MSLSAPILAALLHGALHGGLCGALETGGSDGETRILVVPRVVAGSNTGPDEGPDEGPDAANEGAVDAAARARAEELYAGLRAAGLLPVSVEERAGVDLPVGAEPTPGTRDGARALLQEARARLRELDAEGARGAADGALDELVRLDQPEDALELFADVLLFRANLALVEGREDDARADLLLLSRLEPARTELHPGLYPPSLVEAYAAVRAGVADGPRATLVVRARAARFGETRVLVDARAWDGAPLAPGPHLITVRADGAATRSELRVLDAATPAILEPFLAPPGAGARRATLTAEARAAKTPAARTAALAALADQCAARAVLLEDVAAFSLFVPGRPLRTLAPPARDGVVVGRVVLAALQPPRAEVPGVEPEDPGPSPALVWGAVAGSAALLVLGVGAGVGAWALWPADPPAPPAKPVIANGPTD